MGLYNNKNIYDRKKLLWQYIKIRHRYWNLSTKNLCKIQKNELKMLKKLRVRYRYILENIIRYVTACSLRKHQRISEFMIYHFFVNDLLNVCHLPYVYTQCQLYVVK